MSSSEFWYLRPGLILPTPAVLAVLDLERQGHQLTLDEDGENIRIASPPGVALVSEDVEALRKWKAHAVLFIGYCLNDGARGGGAQTPAPSPTDWRMDSGYGA